MKRDIVDVKFIDYEFKTTKSYVGICNDNLHMIKILDYFEEKIIDIIHGECEDINIFLVKFEDFIYFYKSEREWIKEETNLIFVEVIVTNSSYLIIELPESSYLLDDDNSVSLAPTSVYDFDYDFKLCFGVNGPVQIDFCENSNKYALIYIEDRVVYYNPKSFTNCPTIILNSIPYSIQVAMRRGYVKCCPEAIANMKGGFIMKYIKRGNLYFKRRNSVHLLSQSNRTFRKEDNY